MSDLPLYPFLLITVIMISLPVFWQLWKWFFGNGDGFVDDLRSAVEPDWYALWRGRYLEGEWAELKIAVFLALCFGCVASLYKLGLLILY